MAGLSQMRIALLDSSSLPISAFHQELAQHVCHLDSDSCPENNRKLKSLKRQKCPSLAQKRFCQSVSCLETLQEACHSSLPHPGALRRWSRVAALPTFQVTCLGCVETGKLQRGCALIPQYPPRSVPSYLGEVTLAGKCLVTITTSVPGPAITCPWTNCH